MLSPNGSMCKLLKTQLNSFASKRLKPSHRGAPVAQLINPLLRMRCKSSTRSKCFSRICFKNGPRALQPRARSNTMRSSIAELCSSKGRDAGSTDHAMYDSGNPFRSTVAKGSARVTSPIEPCRISRILFGSELGTESCIIIAYESVPCRGREKPSLRIELAHGALQTIQVFAGEWLWQFTQKHFCFIEVN